MSARLFPCLFSVIVFTGMGFRLAASQSLAPWWVAVLYFAIEQGTVGLVLRERSHRSALPWVAALICAVMGGGQFGFAPLGDNASPYLCTGLMLGPLVRLIVFAVKDRPSLA